MTLAGDLVVCFLDPLLALLPALCPGRRAFPDHVSGLPCPPFQLDLAHGEHWRDLARKRVRLAYLFPSSFPIGLSQTGCVPQLRTTVAVRGLFLSPEDSGFSPLPDWLMTAPLAPALGAALSFVGSSTLPILLEGAICSCWDSDWDHFEGTHVWDQILIRSLLWVNRFISLSPLDFLFCTIEQK